MTVPTTIDADDYTETVDDFATEVADREEDSADWMKTSMIAQDVTADHEYLDGYDSQLRVVNLSESRAEHESQKDNPGLRDVARECFWRDVLEAVEDSEVSDDD